MKKIIVFLLFIPTLVFALDYDKKNDKENNPNNAASKIGALSGSDSGQKVPAEIRTDADFLDLLRIIACIPKDKKLLLGKFAYPDTTLTCYATSVTTFQIRLSQLFDAGFRISQIEDSGNKILYYMER